MSQKVYTVVALYPEGQSFVEAFPANTPIEASNLCVEAMAKVLNNEHSDWGDYEVIAVFSGSHNDVLSH